MELNRYLLASHMPTGRLWESCFLSNTNLGTLIKALSLEFYRMTLRADTFINEIDINKTEQLITEWEKSVGIPNDYFLNTASLSMRRIQIELVLGNFGGVQLSEDFVRVAALLGYEITVSAPGNPELLINGNMELGDPPAYWVPVSTTTLSSVADERTGGSGTQSMNIVKPFHGVCALQNIDTQVDILYKVNGWLKNIDALYTRVLKQDIDSENDVHGTNISATSWTEDTFFFQATSELSQIVLFMAGSEGEQARADDLSVQEVLQGNGIEKLLNGDMEDGGDLGSEILDNGDMELGGGLGSELLSNGDMESGDPPTNWTNWGASTLSRVSDERTGGSGTYSMNSDRGTMDRCSYQDVTTIINERYKVVGWLKNIDATDVQLEKVDIDGVSNVVLGTQIASTSWTEDSFFFKATSTTSRIYLNVNGSSGEDGRFDDISVKQLQDFDDWIGIADALLLGVADERTGGSGTQSMDAERGTSIRCSRQDIVTVIGDWYKISGWLKNIDATDVRIEKSDGDAISNIIHGPRVTSTSWTEVFFFIQATDTTTRIFTDVNGSQGDQGRFDDISVKQVQDFDDWDVTGTAMTIAVADERTGGSGSQCMEATRGTNSTPVNQGFTTVVDSWYEVKGWLKNINATLVQFKKQDAGGPNQVFGDPITSTNWAEDSFFFQATDTATLIILRVDGDEGEQGRFDDISVRQVLPTNNIIVDGDMEGAGGWGVINGATLSKVADERTGGSGTWSMEAERGTAAACATQTVTTALGGKYEASGWLKNIDATSVQLSIVGLTTTASTAVTSTSWTYVSFEFIANTSTVEIQPVVNGITTEEGRFDDLSIVLLEGGGSHQIFIDVETDIEGDVFPFTFPFTFSSGGLTYLQTIFDMLAPANVEVIVS